MPNNILSLDQHLPRFTGRESLENKVDQVQKYQYELLETLRYVLCHLDTRNFNMTEINSFVQTITDPFDKRLEDAEGNITEIKITAKGIETMVTNQAGDISRIKQTADKIEMTVQNQAGDISRIEQTAKAIQTTVQNQAGDISQIRQTANAIQTTVQNQAGEISQIRQTADAIQTTVQNQAGEISQIKQTANAIQATVQNQTGEISQIKQTANAIQTTVQNQAGEISQIKQTASAIQSDVQNQAGEISQIRQTASAIQTTVTNQAGEISQIRQTANSIQSTVADQTRQIGTMIEQTVDSITLEVENGEDSSVIKLMRGGINLLASQEIRLTGMVTFSALSEDSGRTFINGGNIITSNLKLDRLYGQQIFLYGGNGEISAVFTLSDAYSYEGQKVMLASGAIDLRAQSGAVFMQASGGAALQLGNGYGDMQVQVTGDLIPNSPNRYDCGTSEFPWLDVYSQDGTIQSSDREGKDEIDYDMSRYRGLFDRLRPCSFLRKNGTSGRRHHGLIAQDVEDAMKAEGMSGMDFAGFVRWKDGCGLRYEELIAMLIYEVQELKKSRNG